MTKSEKSSPAIWLRLRPRFTLAKLSTALTVMSLAGVAALSPFVIPSWHHTQVKAPDVKPSQAMTAPNVAPVPAPPAVAPGPAPQNTSTAAKTATAPDIPPSKPAIAAPPPPVVSTASFSPPPPAVVQETKTPSAKDKKHLILARDLFGAVSTPAPLRARAAGFYSKGCLSGARALPLNGPSWQAMRVSRNRNWGHPSLVKFIEKFANDAKTLDGWPGLLVGDMSQPRGGPMTYGHASHQVGLDVDIWLKPMPDRELTTKERDDMPFETLVGDNNEVNPQRWSPLYEKLLRRVASYREVDRVFINPVIKKKLCQTTGKNRAFLHKFKALWGHDAHFHVRLVCPRGQTGCRQQPPLKGGERCGKGLDRWLKVLAKEAAKKKKAVPVPIPGTASAPPPRIVPAKDLPARRRITLKQLPRECTAILAAAPAPQNAGKQSKTAGK